MSIDDATAGLLARLQSWDGARPLPEMTPEEARGFGGRLRELYGSGPQLARVRDDAIPAADGGSIPIRILSPAQPPRAVIVYYHGGGWTMGGIDDCETLGRRLAQRTGAVLVLVDYRLAPEHRFPVAVHDAWDALRWVDAHLDAIAGARVPLVVAGDSAGGNLAAVVSRRARDAGGPRIALQALVYPVCDCDLDTASYLDPSNQLIVSREAMIWYWDHYLPDLDARADPDASPLRAADLSGLPPAIVLTAEHDPLRDEGEAYAERLRASGVPVEHRRFASQMHGFFTMVNVLPGSEAGIDYLCDELVGHLDAPSDQPEERA